MPKFFLRFLALSILCAAGAFGQGTFGQIAFGGSWQTTFTLMNMSTTSADVTLSFFDDNGLPLAAPVQGFGVMSVYTFTIPPSNAQNVVLSSLAGTTTQGWASMSTTGNVRGQGSFRFQLPSGVISEAVVPLSRPAQLECIVSFPPPDPVIVIPFDNTGGQDNTANQYVTSLAFVNTNTKSTSKSFAMEFYDQSNKLLAAPSLLLAAMGHTAFVSKDAYPALRNTKGILRIHASTADLTVLGLLSNFTGAITTIMPVTQ
jgi:hypothetical protein